MNYLIITNNIDGVRLFETYGTCVYVEGSVRDVLNVGYQKAEAGYVLASDPMAGRRARPFPYLTLIFSQDSTEKRLQYTWNRLLDYEILDRNRLKSYEKLSQDMQKDYRVLDLSLSKISI